MYFGVAYLVWLSEYEGRYASIFNSLLINLDFANIS